MTIPIFLIELTNFNNYVPGLYKCLPYFSVESLVDVTEHNQLVTSVHHILDGADESVHFLRHGVFQAPEPFVYENLAYA